jgi:aspartate/methionine/tyrosine aminotransferase
LTDRGYARRSSVMGRRLSRRVDPLHQLGVLADPDPELIDLITPEKVTVLPLVRDALASALERGETHYTARTGIEPLRQRVAEQSTSEGFPASQEHVVITNGGAEALFIALQSLAVADERAVLVEPVSPGLADVVRFTGMLPEIVMTAREARLDGARIVVVSAASGISGRMLPADDLVELLNVASRHGVTVVIDRSSVPDSYEPPPPFSRPDLATHSITVGSFSVAYGLAGWRVGYFTAPEGLMDRLSGLKESMSISTTTPSQFAALAVLEHSETVLSHARERFASRRDRISRFLDDSGLSFRLPDVYPGLLIDLSQSEVDDNEFARRLETNAGVRVEPASRYGVSLAGHVRIDLRASEALLDEGFRRLARFMAGETR